MFQSFTPQACIWKLVLEPACREAGPVSGLCGAQSGSVASVSLGIVNVSSSEENRANNTDSGQESDVYLDYFEYQRETEESDLK